MAPNEHALLEDARLVALRAELEKALACFEGDDKHTALRENVIFPQLADRLLTDTERATFYGLPAGCRMREGAKIVCPEELVCGEHVYIGENVILDASGGLEIGAHTTLAAGVFVWTHTSAWANIALANYPANPFIRRKSTKIGKGVFVAGYSVVAHGVTIGDQSIVLPMSRVDRDFPEGRVIIGGSPAEVVEPIRAEKIDQLIKEAQALHDVGSG